MLTVWTALERLRAKTITRSRANVTKASDGERFVTCRDADVIGRGRTRRLGCGRRAFMFDPLPGARRAPPIRAARRPNGPAALAGAVPCRRDIRPAARSPLPHR